MCSCCSTCGAQCSYHGTTVNGHTPTRGCTCVTPEQATKSLAIVTAAQNVRTGYATSPTITQALLDHIERLEKQIKDSELHTTR